MANIHPEFSRAINTSRIPPKGLEESLEAKPAERTALAKRFDLVDLRYLNAQVTLSPENNGGVRATGLMEAEVVQKCSVSLEPLTNRIVVDIDVLFFPEEHKKAREAMSLDDEFENEIEFFSGGRIDLGEMLAQQLGVNIDPYARKPEATLTIDADEEQAAGAHPFAKIGIKIKD